MIRILTLSNKPHMLPDAVRSVEEQTRKSGVKHIIQLDDGSYDWGERFPPNVFWNQQLALADPEDLMLWLSDDDLLFPDAVYNLAGYLESHPHANACYGAGQMWLHTPPKPDVFLAAVEARQTYDGRSLLAGKIGAGMVMWRAKCWQVVGPFPEMGDKWTSLSDGIWFTQLALKCGGLRAINKDVVYTRVTPWSAHTVPDGKGSYLPADWRKQRVRTGE